MLFQLNMALKNLILITLGLIFLNGVHTASYEWYTGSITPREVSPLNFEILHENEQHHDPHAHDSKHPDPHAQDTHHQPHPHAQDTNHPDPHAQDTHHQPHPHAQDTNHPDPHAQDTKHPTQEQHQDKGNTHAPPQIHSHKHDEDMSHHHPHHHNPSHHYYHHNPSHHYYHHHHHGYDEIQKHANCHAACNIICGGAGSWNAARDACQCAVHDDKVSECAKTITKIQEETGWPRELIIASGGGQGHAEYYYGHEHHRAHRSIERPFTLLFPYHYPNQKKAARAPVLVHRKPKKGSILKIYKKMRRLFSKYIFNLKNIIL